MAELDLTGRCCTAEPVGTLPFICTGESTNDVVEFQARTEVTSAVLMNVQTQNGSRVRTGTVSHLWQVNSIQSASLLST